MKHEITGEFLTLILMGANIVLYRKGVDSYSYLLDVRHINYTAQLRDDATPKFLRIEDSMMCSEYYCGLSEAKKYFNDAIQDARILRQMKIENETKLH